MTWDSLPRVIGAAARAEAAEAGEQFDDLTPTQQHLLRERAERILSVALPHLLEEVEERLVMLRRKREEQAQRADRIAGRLARVISAAPMQATLDSSGALVTGDPVDDLVGLLMDLSTEHGVTYDIADEQGGIVGHGATRGLSRGDAEEMAESFNTPGIYQPPMPHGQVRVNAQPSTRLVTSWRASTPLPAQES